MFVIGITGGIGSGKTTVAQICAQTGLPVLDADQISRNVTAAGGSALPMIVEQFGEDMLAEDGSLNRAKMAALVFENRRSLDNLSQIIHRQVLAEMGAGLEKLRQNKIKAAFLDVPIPVREGFLDQCDQVWVVWADEDIRIKRLVKRGMSTDEARRRIRMQMTDDEYKALATHLIENNSDQATLFEKVKALITEELGQRGIRYNVITNADSDNNDDSADSN